jgi:dTDP-4-amino-4,6-dideoxygalactose transaminase
VKLRHLEDWSNARGENARRYRELFRHYELLDAVELPETLPGRRHVYNQYCVRVRGGLRDQVLGHLRANDIGAAIYYPRPLHMQEAFRHLELAVGDFPEAETASREVLALPIFSELQPVQQELVVRGIAAALGRLGTQTPGGGPATLALPQSPAHRRAA